MSRRRVKILFTIPNFITAGSGREMVNIIERLDKTKFDPTICIRREGGSLEQELKQKGYAVLISPFSVEGRDKVVALFSILMLAFNFRKYHFDLWHSFNWSSDFTEPIIARLAGAKFVYTKKNMNWNRLSWKLKSKLSNHVIARNKAMLQRFFASPSYRGKTTYIPGGVDTKKFFPHNKKSSDRFRCEYSIPNDAFVITQIAQLVPVKGQDILLKAIAHVPGVFVFLAGGYRNLPYVNVLKELVAEFALNDRVFFLGSIEGTAELLHESNCFVLPTTLHHGHEEGCPVALLEAMACGVPCIASDVAGSNDLIRPGVNGLLFRPEDVDDLREKIFLTVKNSSTATLLGSQAALDIASNYTLEHEAENFQKLYSSLVTI